jgi:hypothetical protein
MNTGSFIDSYIDEINEKTTRPKPNTPNPDYTTPQLTRKQECRVPAVEACDWLG